MGKTRGDSSWFVPRFGSRVMLGQFAEPGGGTVALELAPEAVR